MCTLGRSVEQICSWIFHGGSSNYRDFFLRACRRAVSERKKNASQNARAGRNGARCRDGNRRDHRGAEGRGVPQKVQFDTKSTLLRPENNPAENNTRFYSNFCRIASVFLPWWLSSRECISLDVVSSSVLNHASGFLFVHLMDNTRINKGPVSMFSVLARRVNCTTSDAYGLSNVRVCETIRFYIDINVPHEMYRTREIFHTRNYE